MAIIEIKGIKKHFDEVKAVDGVDITIYKGELMVILGPSGCGKTTLMRMIAGLEEPTEGKIFIGEKDVTALPPRDRNIAMVFQSYALYPHMTVFNNIAFPLKSVGGMKKEEIHEKVVGAAATFGIEGKLERKPRHLSGGERQRVALCRAMVKEPDVLLLDEPLSNLDAKLRASARDELQRFQHQTGITTIFVTHDQIEAMGMGDRIVVMNAGKVRQIGTPEEIYHYSKDTFVATFLGSPGMNLIEMDDHLVGFRPENFLPREVSQPQDQLTNYSFSVSRIEDLGADRLIYGEIPGSDGERVKATAKLPSAISIPIAAGKTYDFVVQSKKTHIYSKETGLRTEV